MSSLHSWTMRGWVLDQYSGSLTGF